MASEIGVNKYDRYGQPSIDLIFTELKKSLKSRVGNQQVEFTRSSVGTYVGSDGLIKTAVDDEARFDHDPVTGESLGLLIEESRTNLQYPSIPSAAVSSTVTTNAAVSPDGTTTATFVETDGGGLGTSASITKTNTYYAHSFYFKPGGYNVAGIDYGSGYPDSYAEAWIDVTTGSSFVIDTFVSISSTSVGNGWYRIFALQLIVVSGTTPSWGKLLSTRPDVPTQRNQAFTPTPGSGGYFWGHQEEAGSSLTSHIPTTGSTITRAADVATVSNANNVAYPSTNTLVQRPFGASAIGLPSLSITAGNTVKRISVYPGTLSQKQINAAAEKTDEFWRWRINATDGTFGLGSIYIGGPVTVDWGDGSALETINNGDNNTHTFAGGPGIYEVGFKGANLFYTRFFYDAPNAVKVVAIGPAPENIRFDPGLALTYCSNLQSFDATVNTSLSTNMFYAFQSCSSLKSFPLLDTSSVTNFTHTWQDCTSLTSFPLIDTSSATTFLNAWLNCTSLTSFPAIDTSNGLYFGSPSSGTGTWRNCNSLTSFPLLDFSSALWLNGAWFGCTGLTSFPNIDTSSVILFGGSNQGAWQQCSNLTSFPLINTSSATDLTKTWRECSSLTSFPSIDTSNCQFFADTWNNCSSLTAFPALDFSSATGNLGSDTGGAGTWRNCSGLTSFPFIDISGINGNISGAWFGCTGLTSFPLLNFSNVTLFGASNQGCWQNCTGLTSFPAINISSGTRFTKAWLGCSGLTSFPLLDFSNATSIEDAWNNCSGLTSFPLIDTSNVTTRLGSPTGGTGTWHNCSGLTSFPALDLSNCTDVTELGLNVLV